ncbi:hypothetical protein DAPPUDRAFT_323415 [Daphnia pulex]|uniref:Uncharacterized protein n=1 Tax=Daphnia pulex TaxID=6669 RepID=E9GYT6_DAPPU|nr:hypothetical protein DAPPUDRAFT_323415 [Daphnia pulex]|eukprot:EFX75356.1 hypothetical protein DAPPUDRAFT_323415 [Daphnia pulex]
MSEGVVYPEVLSLIYLEVTTRIGITCQIDNQPIRTPLSKNPILICKFKGAVEEFYIDMCKPGGFLDGPSDDPQSDDLPVLWPVKAKVVENVQVCLEVEDLVEVAHRLLQLAEVNSDEPAMIECKDKLLSQQTQINEVKQELVNKYKDTLVAHASSSSIAVNTVSITPPDTPVKGRTEHFRLVFKQLELMKGNEELEKRKLELIKENELLEKQKKEKEDEDKL